MMRFLQVVLLAALWVSSSTLAAPIQDVSASKVFLNGVPTPVVFNDGDSFRVLTGPLAGTKARLEGFNTLETFGPAHQWGGWGGFELYAFAKMATLNARRGVWHCSSPELKPDTYGRILWVCPDLAVDHIRKGLAMVMTVSQEPGRIEYIRAQREAIEARRGIWAKGVPAFVVTSLHSASEDSSKKEHYNRLISTADGHSEPWSHNNTYSTCEIVCGMEKHIEKDRLEKMVLALRADASLGPALESFSNLHLELLVSMFGRRDFLPDWTPESAKQPLISFLTAARERGDFGTITETKGSCGLYVPFEIRYSNPRPTCLEHP